MTRLHLWILVSLQALCCSFSFQALRSCRVETSLYGKVRKTKRKVEKSRPQQFYDAIADAQDKATTSQTATKDPDPYDEERQARAAEAQRRMDQRPDVSTMIVDEETGIEMLAQGKNVMDVVTRKAVKLSDLGPMYRLAQMFPGVPPDVREKHRVDWKTVQVEELVEKLREAASVKLPDGSRAIPPHPSVSNNALDFVIANRDLLGNRMKRTLARLTMRSMYLGNEKEAAENKKLWKNFLTLENHISAPFRQIIQDAEGRVGPQFGNLDLMSFCKGEVYERAANYLVLKGMVAHWEKKVVDADFIEKTPQTKENFIRVLSRGDPKRYLPDPPILFTLRECTQVCLMSQQMTKAFVETPELFDDLPVEVRFLEAALSIRGGTPLRKFMIEEFCPAEGVTPEALREGMRRLQIQLENMQIDPYADLCNLVERLCVAMAVGTDDERNPYIEYLANKDPNGPGRFQTYTFNHEKMSLVRFLDSQYDGVNVPAPSNAGIGGLFNFGGVQPESSSKIDDSKYYKIPAARAAGRPHELGWLKLLDADEEDKASSRFGKMKPGKIVVEDSGN